MKASSLVKFLLFTSINIAFAQKTSIKGRLYNPVNNEPVAFAPVLVQGTTNVVESDIDGKFEIFDLKPGLYNLEVNYIGFKKKVIYEIQVSNAVAAFVDIPLEEDLKELEEVVVRTSPFNKTDETPLSIRTLGANEIERYPGGNRDISRVIQSLPGVASTASFRNDIIIRGGAPNENKFYVDEIEVPVINHFATQGSSGGPVGILNVNLIKSVDVLSGAFPANRFNTNSSIFEFKLKDGRNDRYFTQATIGASEFTVSNEGPIGKKTTYIASVRRSYLQNLFRIIGLPFLPTFNDYTVKVKTKFNQKNELTFLSIGAYDYNRLDRTPIDRAKTPEERDEKLFIWENIPISTQWNYVVGLNYRHYRKNGYYSVIVSRNMLENSAFKYRNNDESTEDNLNLRYKSQEGENKVRIEDYRKIGGLNLRYGVNYEYTRYYNNTFQRFVTPTINDVFRFETTSYFNAYGAFVQASKTFLKERLNVSAGLRTDASDFSEHASNPLNQLSPRISASYAFNEKLFWNFNTGIYYQKPAYTILGYRDNSGRAVNKDNNVKFVSCTHYVTGFEYNTNKNSKFTVEGFYKDYVFYPASVINRISLANLGADFGVIGNEPVVSTSKGRAYGAEFLAQQKLYKGFFGIAALTLVRSEFTNENTGFLPSAWDNQVIVSLTAGKKFKKNWELGARWRYLGGQPYIPIDVETSSRIASWNSLGRAVPDFSRINQERLPAFHQLDIRLDKKYFFNKWNFNWYIDIQNFYNFKAQQPDVLVLQRDPQTGVPLVNDPNNPTAYLTKFVTNTAGTILPTVGIIVEF
ncbi:MAG: carboxypeptidase-like regulatory domain-containing protein [Cytophagales bacterium]